jgi:hypothetical protein
MVVNENMETVKFGIYLDEIEKYEIDPKKG